MTSDPASRTPYDPASGALPADLRALGDELAEGRIVAIATPSSSAAGGWRARAAVSLARAWSGITPRLFLMDLCLENPVLHYFLGEKNGEGVADVLVFGASLERVARPVDEGGFFFAPAGTAISNPRQVLAHRRWDRLALGFREARATLVLYLPLDLEGSTEVLGRADDVVLLDATGASPGAWSEKLVAHLEPDGAGADVVRPEPGEPDEASPLPPEPPAPDEREVVEIGELAPDPVSGEPPPGTPVVPIADLAPEPDPAGGVGEPAVTPIGELAPDAVEPASAPTTGSPAPEPAPVPIAELAPETGAVEEPEPEPGPVVGIAELAPEPGKAVAPVPAEAPSGFEGPAQEEEPGAAPRHDAGEEAPDEAAPPEVTDEDGVRDEPVAAPEQPAATPEGGVDEPEAGALEADPAAGEPTAGETAAAPEEPVEEAEDGGAGGADEFDLDSLDALVARGGALEDPSDQPPGLAPEFAGAGPDEGTEPGREREGEEPPDGGDRPAEAGPPAGADREGRDAAEAGGPALEAEAPGSGGHDFGDDLVTGPDFGGPAPGERRTDEAGGPGAGKGAPAAVSDLRPDSGGEGPPRAGGGDRESVLPPRPDLERREPEAPSRSRVVRLLVLLLVVSVGAAAAHWYGVVRVPGVDRAVASILGPAFTGRAPIVDTSGPQPESPVLSHSLTLDAYRDVTTVQDVAAALRERLPDLLFVVAPFQEEGEVFHRLLVGPAASVDEAEALRIPLSGILNREDSDRWAVRATPLAFVVDEAGTESAARSRLVQVEEAGIPAYLLRVAYPDGSEVFRVYAGAYGSPEDARALRGMLAAEGFTDLIFAERRGRLPE